MVEKSSPLRAAIRWLAPPALAVALYWGGLTSWFQKDDFAWLSLCNLLAAGKSLGWILFHPLAQGTIRTLSERVFFTSLFQFFKLNPLPYHLAGLVTFLISLVLLQSVTAKLTGSRAAGFWAAILWTANGSLAIPLSWNAVYYELLCACFFLIDVWLLLRYLETDDNRYYAAQVATFLAGFFVLELNVVYPAIALIIVLCRAPRVSWKFIWLFPISAIYAVLHFVVSPLPAEGPYKLYWDLHMVRTLVTYVNWAFGTGWLNLLNFHSFALRIALASPIAAGLIAFLVAKIRQKQWIALLFPAWFVIILAPLLPLREHMSYEYLTVPLIGLAMWGGWALASSNRFVAIPLAVIYLAIAIPVGHVMTAQFHDRSFRLRDTFYAVEAAHRAHPDATVIFTGANPETFHDMIYHHAFALTGIQAYVAPEEVARLGPASKDLAIDAALERRMLDRGSAVVYDLSNGVRDVTAESRSTAPRATLAAKIELGNDVFADQLGPSWYRAESGHRWMPQRASLKLAGGRTLRISGFAPAAALKNGALTLQVTANGQKLPPAIIRRPEAAFDLDFDLPPGLNGKEVALELELDRTFRVPGDPRVLGLAFTSIETKN